VLNLLVAAMLVASADRAELLDQSAAQFEFALQRNDVQALDGVLSPDWLVIDSDGRSISREKFLGLLRTRVLSHSAMQSSETRVRLYGESAIVTARTDGAGNFAGQPFKFSEQSTDVWVWVDGKWVCAFTQLTRIAPTK
jgi:ketosteroid isomerase-like protein